MNAMTPLPPAVIDSDTFAAAIAAVNAWRGRALSCFTSVERAVTETLVELASRDPHVDLPHLLGPRLDAIEVALERREDGAIARYALRLFREHDGLRTFLAHGDAKITLDQSGKWLALFHVVALRGGKAERSFLAVEEHEAGALVKRVRGAGQRVCSALRRLPLEPGSVPGLKVGTVLPLTPPDT